LLKKVILLIASLLVSGAIAELVAGFVVEWAKFGVVHLDYETLLASHDRNKERLYRHDYIANYDIRGLYRNAESAVLRSGPHRTIEPEPTTRTGVTVLFLGGSTTEAAYVAEGKRWVAGLDRHPAYTAYNAGQSSANSIDKFRSLRYLSEVEALRFDVVVLITAANDFSWEKWLSEFGGTLLPDQYDESVRSFVIGRELNRLGFLDHASHYSDFATILNAATKRLSSHFRTLKRERSDQEGALGYSNVVASYERSKRQTLSDLGPDEVTLEDCPEIAFLLDRYRRNSLVNLRRHNEEVQKYGAILVVTSEPFSYLAPSESFHRDLRHPLVCSGGILSNSEAQNMWNEVNRSYLKAAEQLGIATIDLAQVMQEHTNGDSGGSFMYDEMHYTDKGCEVAIREVDPILWTAGQRC
jgi:hypothetical protein